jgi:hypothetical protein
MKKLLPISLLVLALSLSGCALFRHNKTSTQTSAESPSTPKIVTPDESMEAKVLSVNTIGRFVVLNFPSGRMPKIDQQMFLYRNGLKIAEVKVVGPQQDMSIVADIISGDAQPGDAVRDK